MVHGGDIINYKSYTYILISALVVANFAIIFNIEVLRQLFGFMFLTIFPGILINSILKTNKLPFIEQLVLSIGNSLFFLVFLGLSLNQLALYVGYETPLAPIPLLISFDIVSIVLIIIGYTINKELFVFKRSSLDLSLTLSEKTFLIFPIIFPTLTVLGLQIMNSLNDNRILLLILFFIAVYITIICVLNNRFPERLYPSVIFSISISLLLLMSLRSNHILGFDVHSEYYLFQTTLNNLNWHLIGNSTLNSVLVISLLPTIYQSMLSIAPEILYKLLFSSIYSVSPLIVYILSAKYLPKIYSFLASCFFIISPNFLLTAVNTRSSIATFFFGLGMIALFNENMGLVQKRIYLIMSIIMMILSHYSTSYISFIVLLITYICMEILSMRYCFEKIISSNILCLFFAVIFVWYSQVTVVPFTSGVTYIVESILSLNSLFKIESQSGATQALIGVGILQKSIPQRIEFVLTWMIFAYIGIGIITLIIRYRDILFAELDLQNLHFMKAKLDVGYFVLALVFTGVLVSAFIVPYISKGYSLDRVYGIASLVLSPIFVIGGITLSQLICDIFFNSRIEPRFIKILDKNAFQVQTCLVILILLIPYFFSITGFTYQLLGNPRQITLNSDVEQYDSMYIHDQESYSAKWLQTKREQNKTIYADFVGKRFLISQGMISESEINHNWLSKSSTSLNGYIYLRYQNIIKCKLQDYGETSNMSKFADEISRKNTIYTNSISDVLL